MKLRSKGPFSLLRHLAPAAGAFLLAGCAGSADEGESDALVETPVGVSEELETSPTALWVDVTDELLDSTAEWSNKVELADLDGDGRLDILFANGGNYSEAGAPEANRVFFNRGPGARFEERTTETIGATPDLARVIKARDFNADGMVDVFVGTTYQTQSRLFLGRGGGRLEEVTSTHLPSAPLSLGDAEPGDVDGDGDLDLLLADWGAGNNMTNGGGRTRLWLNDGDARFTDATTRLMPETLVRFSWEVEWVDVDNDYDLDALVSCKRCGGSLLYRNDGAGSFTEDRRALPQYTNNYEFEAMDIDGDEDLDLVTINDGDIVGGRGSSRREHIFVNDGEGRFRDHTDLLWPAAENIGEDDNMVAFLDYDSDGDADFLIGSLSGPDRLLINDGTGAVVSANEVFAGAGTPGTLGIAIADLDDDDRIDVVQAQGEVPGAERERIYLGRGLEPDTAPPVVSIPSATPMNGGLLVRARVHDRKSPSLPTEWSHVEVRADLGDAREIWAMRWYGEYLWAAALPPGATGLTICAADAAGNERCEPVPLS